LIFRAPPARVETVDLCRPDHAFLACTRMPAVVAQPACKIAQTRRSALAFNFIVARGGAVHAPFLPNEGLHLPDRPPALTLARRPEGNLN
jgi:hypothetical protein